MSYYSIVWKLHISIGVLSLCLMVFFLSTVITRAQQITDEVLQPSAFTEVSNVIGTTTAETRIQKISEEGYAEIVREIKITNYLLNELLKK